MPIPAPRSVELIRHPASPTSGVVRRIDVEISTTADGALRLRYFVDGDVSRILVPPLAPVAADRRALAAHLLRGLHRRARVVRLLRVQFLAVHAVGVLRLHRLPGRHGTARARDAAERGGQHHGRPDRARGHRAARDAARAARRLDAARSASPPSSSATTAASRTGRSRIRPNGRTSTTRRASCSRSTAACHGELRHRPAASPSRSCAGRWPDAASRCWRIRPR